MQAVGERLAELSERWQAVGATEWLGVWTGDLGGLEPVLGGG